MQTVPIHVLVGPTAVGKTDVIHRLAREREAVLLSADSMLVYRGMDIGTAKPTPAERAGLIYFGMDLVDPGAPFTVADFLAEAQRARAYCLREHRPLLVVGGTGFYVRCLLEGLRSDPGADWPGRVVREKMVETGRIEELQDELRRRAPEVWATLADRSNPRRIIRALEKVDAGGGAVSRSWAADLNLQPEVAGLNIPRAVLHERIRERIRRMYEGGLMDEVRALLAAGISPVSTAWQAIGYSEAAACLRGELSQGTAMERTLFRTRQLAKRQMTWFRHQLRVRWVDREAGESSEVVAARIAAVWKGIGPVQLKGLD